MIRGARGRTAAAALALLIGACAPGEPSIESPGALWSRTHARLDSLGSIDAPEQAERVLAAARVRAVLEPHGRAPLWLAVDLAATDGTWHRRAQLPAAQRAALAAADHAGLRAAAALECDSLASAHELARRCLAVREAAYGADDVESLRAAMRLAHIAFRMARVAEADSLARAVFERLSPRARESHPLAAEAELVLGRVLKNFAGRIKSEVAMTHYERALAIQRQAFGESSLEAASVHQDMGNLDRMMRRPEAAQTQFLRALAIRRAKLGERHDEVASTLTAIAFLHSSRGDWRRAEHFIRQAFEATPSIADLPPATATLRHGLHGQVLRRLGRDREAIVSLRIAAAEAETAWARSERDAGSSVQSGLSIHRELALALAAEGQPDAAFAELELGHARTWAEVAGGDDPWNGLLARVQRACPEDVALIAWPRMFVAPPGGDYPKWACVIRSQGPVVWVKLPRDRTWARRDLPARDALLMEMDRASHWPLRLSDTRLVDSLGRALAREWFDPIEPHLTGAKRLIVFGPALMGSAPLAILRDSNGRRLDERFTVHYTPSALAFATLAERTSDLTSIVPHAVLVGAPTLAADSVEWAPLTGAAEELASLGRLFPEATVLTGRLASAANLRAVHARRALERGDVLHLAAHIEIDASRVMRSSFVLAPDRPGDDISSRLSASEISSTWKVGARIVSLAGCRSMLGLDSASEGWLGLQSAFLAAGARSVLVTLWSADDDATARLMTEFYRRLLDRAVPVDAAEALRGAQQSVRAWHAADGTMPYAHPVYWAGFALVGSGE